MSEIRVEVLKLISALDAFKADSAQLWASSVPLAMLINALRNANSYVGQQHALLVIDKHFPLRTVPSERKFTLNTGEGNVAVEVVCKVSLTWDCQLGQDRKGSPKHLIVSGLASTLCEFAYVHEGADVPLSEIHFDVQTPGGPGPSMHAQLSDRNNGVGLDIPRLLNAQVSIIDALDLILGDMFPSRWPNIGSSSGDVWKGQQRDRLSYMFKAYAELAATSGWHGLKTTCMHRHGLRL